jgi:anti-sigma B factor antagonist
MMLLTLLVSSKGIAGVARASLVVVLSVAGSFRLPPEPINDLMGKGNKKILLNLGEAAYIDSSGIGVLVSGFSTVRSQGGELKLVNLSKRIRDLLHITKVYSLFDVKDDEAAAVASFR